MKFFDTFEWFLVSFLALFFGTGYNWFVGWLERRGGTESQTAYLVVGGVLVTLLFALRFVGLEASITTLIFFALTGTPMIIGSAWRYLKKKEEGRRMLNDKQI